MRPNNIFDQTGGFTGQFCLQTAEVYDPNTGNWSNIASMSIRRAGAACIGYDGFLYVMGGIEW